MKQVPSKSAEWANELRGRSPTQPLQGTANFSITSSVSLSMLPPAIICVSMSHFLSHVPLQSRRVKCNKEYCERTMTPWRHYWASILLSAWNIHVPADVCLMYSMSRKVKGLTILEGWLPLLRTPIGGISLVSAFVTPPLQSWVALWQTDLWKPCSPALIPSACCLSFSKGLGLPTLRFPQRQNGEILPVIISPQKDVVIKMAAKVFCKIKKHNKTPTEEAYYLYQAFARMSETSHLWWRMSETFFISDEEPGLAFKIFSGITVPLASSLLQNNHW